MEPCIIIGLIAFLSIYEIESESSKDKRSGSVQQTGSNSHSVDQISLLLVSAIISMMLLGVVNTLKN